ncbi:GNAT family N-acetyltransferase [Streptomyces sp. RPT161]|uniref:GNAT family N-acetyltransferase n=1 Tax=Streptomyces sp. RPT161 TaxID=3015993 RepID=UPI0022B88528|nr:GNAT family protein [Streptomyces sp. RPT161]
MPAKTPSAVVLEGRHVRLEPLTLHHVAGLFTAGADDEEIWRWLPVPAPRTPDDLRATAEKLLADAERRALVPFAVIDRATGRPLGWTTYLEIEERDERLEIGWTWYVRSAWRTAVNSETKLLLLTHAFEELGYGRVQWKTHHRNERSQQAIARLGAVKEGVLRRHKLQADGSWRDSVYFSMLADEWPAAKANLMKRLARG